MLHLPTRAGRRVTAVVLALLLACLPVSQARAAKPPKGDVLEAMARAAEARGRLDEALKYAVEALASDPNNAEYQLTESRLRALAGEYHVHQGDKLVGQGKLEEALAEYEKAAAIDPAPSVARAAAGRVREVMKQMKAHPEGDVAGLLRSPRQKAEEAAAQAFASIRGPARLDVQLPRPLPQMRVNNQLSGEVFALVGKYAGIRVVFEPDYQSQSLGKNQLLDFRGMSLEEALNYVALVSKSFWRPISRDTILVANEDPNKRALFDDQVTKVLYLTNAPTPQEVQRIGETVKNVTDMKRLLIHPDQSALVLRGDPDRVALAEKLVDDLDKPKAEIIIDVIVLSVSKDWVRDLGLVMGVTPTNLNVGFAPTKVPGAATNSAGVATIPLSALRHLTAGDFAITLPGAALNALMSNQTTRIVDKAQLRTVEGQRSSLRIGQKIPYATGSFAPGGAGNASPLVNTQFSFFDVGLNIDVVAKVHEPDEVSLHIESDHSAVADYQNVGGIVQPIITQRKRVADVRVKEGEVNFWDIISEKQSQKLTSGLPGLGAIPVLGRMLTSTHRQESETMLLHLLMPHIIRSPDIREVNVLGIASGSEQVVRLAYTLSAGGAAAVRSAPTDEVVDVVQTQAATAAPAPAGAAVSAGASAAAQPAPAGPPGVEFAAPNMSAVVGTTIPVEIRAVNVADVAGADLVVRFDPEMLKLQESTPGTFLGRDGAAAQLKIDGDPSSGRLAVKLARPGAGPAPNGAGPLLILKFEARKAGDVSVNIVSAALRNSQGKDLQPNTGSLDIAIK